MSVEPSEVVSDVWTRWQGHVVNGVFPLGRYLGSSDHSGVFLTRSAGRPSEVAIKLVPTNRALAEVQLPRWKRASGLVHPHLLRLFEFGGCQLDGLPYLYAVMEYADQTLAQLLLHRALTEGEVKEMLSPSLGALAFLHARGLVQGQLKPTNILVVGDQLKLASDTIRRVSESVINTFSVYDPPEARHGGSSTADDVWALGVSLSEALTRRQPTGPGHPGEAVLPVDFSPAFRDVVIRCLSPAAEHRPRVTELIAWAGGQSAEPTTAMEPIADVRPEPSAPEPSAPEPSAPEPSAPEPGAAEPSAPEPRAAEASAPQTSAPEVSAPKASTPARNTAASSAPESSPPKPSPPQSAAPLVAAGVARVAPAVRRYVQPRHLRAVILGALVVLALAWTVLRLRHSHGAPVPPAPPVQASEGSVQTPGTAADGAGEAGTHASALPGTNLTRSDLAKSPSAMHEVIPEVPQAARRTIRGHVKVWVRVIVDQDGSVFAATPDRAGSSRYFERLAIEAAKKWTFPLADTPSRRLMQVRFDFTRDGTTARAVTLH